MLKQRVITALVLAAVFLAALFYFPVPLFSTFVAIVMLVGGWEWANLSGFVRPWQRLLYVLLLAVVTALAGYYLGVVVWSVDVVLDPDKFRNLLVIGCIWWAVALLFVQGFPSSAILWRHSLLRGVMGLCVLVPAWAAFTYVRAQEHGALLVLLIVAVVACADIGGYFTGRRWGKRKLAPAVSPGKTWEGFLGGVCFNFLLSIVVWVFVGGNYVLLLAIILPTSLVSVLGDLFESMLKRQRGIKDSSALLPGHGGVLDRVDSLTAAAPVFALALLSTGWPG